MKRRAFLQQTSVGLTAAGLFGSVKNGISQNGKRPNVIIMMGDDIGYSDLGCYGAEIETPNLDRLANNGVRFTQMYNMAKCNPTRSSLFTGMYLPREHAVNAQAFPQLMRDAGYYTAMSGKEHYDKWVPQRCYADQCFDDRMIYSVINEFFIPPDGTFENPFFLNGEQIEPKDMLVEEEPFYKTDVVTNYALQFLENADQKDQPFYLYLPYHPAHYPLQAREEDIAKYRGKYKKGWDVIRKERFERQKELGVIPADCTLSPPEDNINKYRGPFRGDIYKYRPWDSVPAQEQDELDLEMAVFAAMVDRMDQNIGRVLDKVEEMGELDNTLIIYLSDNGSCPYDSNRDFSIPPGGAASYRTLSAAWANVGDTPFRFYKQYGHEGGAHTHFIAHMPNMIEPGLCDAPASVVDIFPTMMDLCGAEYPSTFEGNPTPELDGQSLVPLFEGGERPEPEIIVSGFSDRFRMVRVGDWKIVRVNEGDWELYNLKDDPTELHNLADAMPEKLNKIEQQYLNWKS